MSDARITFTVPRPCAHGECPATLGGACDCYAARGVEVGVDELSEVELGNYLAHGTEEQKTEIREYLDAEVARDWPGSADEPEGPDMEGEVMSAMAA